MSPTRIAIAGVGSIGTAHLAALQASPRCRASALVDPSPAARALADAADVPLYASLDELFAADRPDGIILATPNALHVAQAVACIDAGIPVLLEKPIAPTVAEAERLVAHAEARGAKLLIGHHRAHSPIMARAQDVIRSGALGRIVALTGSATFHKPDSYFASATWRREAGGGPMLLNLIHEVHNLRMLCGEIAAVQAIASNAVRGFEVEDTVAITLRFASGALGSFMLSDCAASPRSWEQTSQENPVYASDPDEDCYVVAGTHGSLAFPSMRLATFADGAERSWCTPFEREVVDVRRADPLARQLEHFGAVIRGEATPLVSARDGLANLRVTEAIAAAARSGGTVELTETRSTLQGAQ